MFDVKIVMEGQVIPCNGRLFGQLFKGRLSEPIRQKAVLEFWNEYEKAVTNVLLSEIEKLESKMSVFRFHVLVDGTRFTSSNVDLQIYPSTMMLSFKFPKPP